jgi:hypothetical protein
MPTYIEYLSNSRRSMVVRLSPLGTVATTGLLYQPQMIDDGDCGEISGMKIGRGNRGTRRKPAPAPLCPPQIPHDQTWARTRAAAVGSQRLTAWAMARPEVYGNSILQSFCRRLGFIIVQFLTLRYIWFRSILLILKVPACWIFPRNLHRLCYFWMNARNE